ncbi:MAG: phosphate/phosphite/phosphonate ABC transporter substrate-binding protein [Bacteroidota bacterium]|nr:phosphate/phosphite/phosphonate ABC transporter substrate-binding protein [Bacteroidota bacterium]
MKVINCFLFTLVVCICLTISSCKGVKEGELGSKSNPIKMYFAPSLDTKKILDNVQDLVDYLESETGYYFKVETPKTHLAIVKAFEQNEADIAEINSFPYLIVNKKYGAEALLRVIRDGNEQTYRGEIITRFDSGINSLDDITGKRFAYVDSTSTSGYILPKALFNKKNIKPRENIFAIRHDSVVSMVYNKQVDAGATYYAPPDSKTGEFRDSRKRLQQKYPDIDKKVKIIGFTQDIPNDPWVFRKGLDAKIKQKIADCLIEYAHTKKGKEVLLEIANISDIIPAKDSDYDYLRSLIKELNIDSDALIQKK